MPLSDMKNSFQGQENGYGIVNIITRLRLMYHDDIVFCVRPEEEGTVFMIRVPARKSEKDGDEQNG